MENINFSAVCCTDHLMDLMDICCGKITITCICFPFPLRQPPIFPLINASEPKIGSAL